MIPSVSAENQPHILWGDIPMTPEEELAAIQWRQTGETGEMLTRIYNEMVRLNTGAPALKKKQIRWSNEPTIVAPVVVIPNAVVDPHEHVLTAEMYNSVINGSFSKNITRDYPQFKPYATIDSSEYSCLKPWQATQVSFVLSQWFNPRITRIVDATAHIGADTINLATVFPSATIDAFEIRMDAYVALLKNLTTFKKTKSIRTHWRDITTWMPAQDEVIDMLYVDPPWGGETYNRVESLDLYLQEEDAAPDAEKNLNNLVDKWLASSIKSVVLKAPNNFNKSYIVSNYDTTAFPILNRAKRLAYTLIRINKKQPTGLIPTPVMIPNKDEDFIQPALKQYQSPPKIIQTTVPVVPAHSLIDGFPTPAPIAAKNPIKTIIVRNLPRDISIPELRNIFGRYGSIENLYVPKNTDKASPHFGTVKGFALIKFFKAEDTAKSFALSCTIRGKKLTIEYAKEDR
jgi:predicted RNA methylase